MVVHACRQLEPSLLQLLAASPLDKAEPCPIEIRDDTLIFNLLPSVSLAVAGQEAHARMLNALVIPTTGKVRVDGLDTASEARAVRRRVGFCFTDPDAQIVMPTVAEDIECGGPAARMLQLESDRGQGYLYSPAVAAGEIENWLRREAVVEALD